MLACNSPLTQLLSAPTHHAVSRKPPPHITCTPSHSNDAVRPHQHPISPTHAGRQPAPLVHCATLTCCCCCCPLPRDRHHVQRPATPVARPVCCRLVVTAAAAARRQQHKGAKAAALPAPQHVSCRPHHASNADGNIWECRPSALCRCRPCCCPREAAAGVADRVLCCCRDEALTQGRDARKDAEHQAPHEAGHRAADSVGTQ